MGPERLLDEATALCGRTEGLVVSVAVVTRGGAEHSRTIGGDGAHLLPSCSSFKPIVAAAVRAAARDGTCSLTDPLDRVTTGLALPRGWQPTLERLLGHLSGLAGDLYEVPVTGASDELAVAEVLRRFLPAVPRVAPGRFWYSNLGYALAAHVLARAEGEPLLAILRRRVLDPAGATVVTDTDTSSDGGSDGVSGTGTGSGSDGVSGTGTGSGSDGVSGTGRDGVSGVGSGTGSTDTSSGGGAGSGSGSGSGSIVAPAFGVPPRHNPSLRPAGSGVHLRALDLARTGAALVGGALGDLGMAPPAPAQVLAAAGQHPAGGFFVDERYGRRLLSHGGGHGAYGAAWVVDPAGGWSAAALFNHPAGYGLDVAAAMLGQARGRDPLRRAGRRPSPGWYLNAYAGVVEVTDGDARGEVMLNGRRVPGWCAADGRGVAVNRTNIVIGCLPFDRIARPDARPTAGLAGRYLGEVDELTIELAEPGSAADEPCCEPGATGAAATVRSAARGESPAVALGPTTLACDHGVVELRGDELVVGGAYRFVRA